MYIKQILQNLQKSFTQRTIPSSRLYSNNVPKITKRIGFIGDGNMAKAICGAIEKKGLISYKDVHVSSPYIKNLDAWKVWGANVTTDNFEVVQKSDIIFLAIKPIIFKAVLSDLCDHSGASTISDKLFVSILAGITLEDLERYIFKFKQSRVIRIMPNIPMMIGEGCTCYCPGKNVSEGDITLVTTILKSCGVFEKLPEHMINAAGALSGSGPAFVYLMIEALSDGGVRMGIHREMATKFAAQTVLGAAKMVLETGKHTGTLKDEVCSAGGTTITGIHALEKGGVRGAIMDAVEASSKKASRLG